MLGRDHIITNVCVGTTAGLGIYCLSQLSVRDPDTIFAPVSEAARVVVDYVAPDPVLLVFGIAFFMLGSLLPDIDSETSILGRFMPVHIGEHRTWTHTFWVIAAFAALGIFAWRPFLWLAAGHATHILADALSTGGICWFWPLSTYREWGSGAKVKRHHPYHLYKVGATSEFVLVGIIIVTSLVLCVLMILWLNGFQVSISK